MAISIVSTTPADGVTGHYIDRDIFVEFSKEIEASYLDSNFFKIYRTNVTKSEYFEFLDVTVTKSGNVVEINPTANFEPLSYYMVIVVGGTNGLQSTDSDTLPANEIFSFQTAETVAPTSGPPEIVPEVDLFMDGDSQDDANEPSTNLFASSGQDAPISLVGSIPANKSVGVDTFSRIILLYNDTVDDDITIPQNALNGRWTDLPVDMDPFGNRRVNMSGVIVSGRQVIFDSATYSSNTNREYIFSMSRGMVRGEEREGFDQREHEIRFMGPLSPVYASPDQINSRLTGWDAELDSGISNYDIWKLILEASLWVRDVYGATMTADNLVQVNRLTICMVLRDLFIRGLLMIGGIRSRTLLAVKVDYETRDWDNIINELEKCIRESIPEDAEMGGAGGAFIGVKSGKALSDLRGEQSKRYGIYR